MTNAILALAGDGAKLVAHADTPWASVTFSGERHTLTLLFEGDDAILCGEALLAELPTLELAFARQMLVEAKSIWTRRQLGESPRLDMQIEILLLDRAVETAA